jgi:hypothetical protein
MTEKTRFSDLVANDEHAALPEKCCAHCSHGRKDLDKGTMKTVYICKAGPAVPVIVPVQTRAGVQFGQQARWPVMMPHEECDAFQLAKEQDPPSA